MPDTPKSALFLGASRGLGLGLVRQHLARGWRVVATLRQRSEELERLRAGHGDRLRIETVDINHPDQVEALRDRLRGERFDLLFVNAGVSGGSDPTASQTPHEEFVRVLTTNAYSPVRAADTLQGLVKPDGTIAFMSSILGSVGSNESGGYEVYRASKAALNTLARSFAARQEEKGRAVLLLHPGWVRTDMGGPQAPLDVETSTKGLTEVLASRQGRGGVAYLDYQGQQIPW